MSRVGVLSCWSRRASPCHDAAEDQPSTNTWVRAPEIILLPTPADPGAPKILRQLPDPSALHYFGRPLGSLCQHGSAELCQAICLHPQVQIFPADFQ